MQRPRPVEPEVNPEASDLAFGRNALIVLMAANGLLLLALLAGLAASMPLLIQSAIWIGLLEGFFFVLIFLPILAYRLLRKKERPKLAASRAIQSFVDALSLAPS